MGLLRFLLALSVVLTHAGGLFGYTMATGSVAVQLFFMISGFLMQLVLSERYDPATDKQLFYVNRALRIFPIYLVVVVLTIALTAIFLPHSGYTAFVQARGQDLGIADMLALGWTAIFIFGQEAFTFLQLTPAGLTFSPMGPDAGTYPLQPVPQAWSLSLELTFYLLAPWIARMRARYAVLLAATALAVVVALRASGLPDDPWSYRVFPAALPLFIAGMLAHRFRRILVPSPLAGGAAAALLILVVLLFNPATQLLIGLGIPGAFLLCKFGAFALAFAGIPALFEWSNRRGHDRLGKLDNHLGELSYPIYITHFLVLVLCTGTWLALQAPSSPLMVVAVVVLTLMASWLVVVLVERPVDRYRARRRLQKKAAARAVFEQEDMPLDSGEHR
jgi:peptidoglycan/LPS O-acetylase OafA/YrhL